jgi:hypothetical protein
MRIVSKFTQVPRQSLPGSAASVTAAAGFPEARALVFWSLFTALSIAVVVPVAWNEYPAMADYPNHLARLHLLTQELARATPSRYYEVRHAFTPNIALDAVAGVLVAAGMPLNAAMRLFAGLALLLPILGAALLGWAVHRSTPWFALMGFAVAFHRYWIWGFLNYSFTLGLALLSAAGWIATRDGMGLRRPWLHAVLFGALGLVILCFHGASFGIYALLVLGFEARRLLIRSTRSSAVRRLAGAFAIPALAYLSVFALFGRGSGGGAQWTDLLNSKIAGLVSPFFSYDQRIAFAFVCVPTNMLGVGMLDRRLMPAVALAGVGLAQTRMGTRAVLAIACVAVALTGLKVWEVQRAWQESSRAFASVRSALTTLEPGSRLMTQVLMDGTRMEYPPVRHTGAFAIVDRDAFIPNLFAFPQLPYSVAYKQNAWELVTLGDDVLVPPGGSVDWTLVCGHYDAVLVFAARNRGVASPCGSVVASGPGFSLFAIEHPRGTSG